MNTDASPDVVVQVALDVPSYINMQAGIAPSAAQLFDYLAPPHVQIGQRVLVPFGRQTLMGLVVEIGRSENAPDVLRHLHGALDDVALLSANCLQLMRFAATYYQRNVGEVALPALPLLLRRADSYRKNDDGAWVSHSMGLLKRRVARFAARARTTPEVAPSLNPAQRIAADSIAARLDAPSFAPFLLYGVTGSGKTEVYLDAIGRVIREGRQALVLVPEINLAPPLEALLRARFGSSVVAAMHSGMSDGERAVNWLAAHEGGAAILVGTRMAVLASLPKLGLLVVDEEHDASFKQQEGLRYSARDLAVIRASIEKIPVVLGSATPSLESWQLAKRGRYQLISLPERAVQKALLPVIECISTRRAQLEHGFTMSARDALARRLAASEQSLVFVNRRGYAPVINCNACGWISDCPRCSAHAVFHKVDGRLRCHHCGWSARPPAVCPDCGNADLAPLGRGTQRVEESLSSWFPTARIARLDRDASQKKGSARAVLESFHAGKIDILVGTQMLAKGHDFKNLTLVVVIGADSALFSHDFRAPERLFANLTQVSGRAGRAAKPGVVLVQSDFVDHPLFTALKRHDFPGFAEQLLVERDEAHLPPFTYQAIVRAEARTLADALGFLGSARAIAIDLADELPLTVYDVVPMSLVKKAGVERAQLLLESAARPALQRALPTLLAKLRELKWRGTWHVEVDPLEI
jgi:primosomal protein N' (replication factor Y) (superfamily II helicase)